ncbi:hypothetical protein LAZ67_3001240 [Cordylochernes scorpioides]|uniref:Latrophilin Cirl n=1 Tax=Cordylochernes scorpioides TaxID=51811 RepID=A0ABY6K6Z1_9ARAC|nr:hypothetical protein LAZ67_3001240 [Cordylochernes scorpioides]
MYACEGRDLRVSCDGEGVIRLARANYGRFSLSLCNDPGRMDWRVNCMSYKSFLIMQNRCHLKPNCSITVSSAIFGDPCPGTLKYLEVQYHCVQGVARWQCSLETHTWVPETPDLGECRSLWLENLRRRMESGESVINVSTELALMTSTKLLFAEDLKELESLIQHTLAKTVNSMESFLDMWHRYHVLRELLQSLLETLSHLLAQDQRQSWEELAPAERRTVAASLAAHLEQSALLLADVSGQDDSFTVAKSNVLLSVQVLNPGSVTAARFNSAEWMDDYMVLPASAFTDLAKHGLAKVVFIAYSQMGQFLSSYESANVTRTINSRVMSASVGRATTRLAQPVIAVLRHLQVENVTNPQCVYWDFPTSSWSGQGCWVQDSNRTHTVCACDHLTNFAVLMDISPTPILPGLQDLIRIIISVGCAVCIMCLLIAVVCLFSTSSSSESGDHRTVLCHMFLCLLVAEAVFVIGIDQTNSRAACGVVAAALHFSLLATFSWSLIEGFQQYVTLAEMSDGTSSRARWYYGFAYGMPACVVAIASLVDGSSYGTSHYCWLRADNYFIFSFIGPAVGALFGAIIFLCIATCILCYHVNLATTLKSKEEAKLASIKSWIRLGFVLVSLLAVTWTCGLLVLHQEVLFLAAAFCGANILLGLFVLCCYCLPYDKVRKVLDNWLTHQSAPQGASKSAEGGVLPPSAPVNGTLPPPATSELSVGTVCPPESCGFQISPKVWNSPPVAAQDGSFTTTPGPLYMGGGESGEVYRAARGSPVRLCVLEPHRWRVQEAWQRSYKPDYSDHIYETIEEDEYRLAAALVQQIPSDYADHSDHSSSSYGYDQRPLLVASLQHPGRQPIYGIAATRTLATPDTRRNHHHHHHHRRTASDHKISNLEAKEVADGTLLPDLLRGPPPGDGSTTVVAILDGQKVVSCLQPEDKLSTYC